MGDWIQSYRIAAEVAARKLTEELSRHAHFAEHEPPGNDRHILLMHALFSVIQLLVEIA